MNRQKISVWLLMTLMITIFASCVKAANKPNEIGSFLELEWVSSIVLSGAVIEVLFDITNLDPSRTLTGITFRLDDKKHLGTLALPPRVPLSSHPFRAVSPQSRLQVGMTLDQRNLSEHELARFFFERVINGLEEPIKFHASSYDLSWK